MRQIGTITQNVTFIPVKGSDFYDDFFDEKGKVEVESVIESVYCNSMLKSTSGKVDVIKKRFTKGITDGLIRFKFEGEEIKFFGIQECKRDIKRNSAAYKYQINQALLYFIQMIEECKVLIIDSINYFDYILIDENIEFLNEIKSNLKHALSFGSPSQSCKKCKFVDLCKLKIHTCDVPNETEINKIMLNIYRNCI